MLDRIAEQPDSLDAIRERARAVRAEARSGGFDGQTAGISPGSVQGNVAILPADWAHEFLNFCRRNPKPCPVLAVSDPGDPMLAELGDRVDIRTDVPRYRVFENGAEIDETTDISNYWRDDLVAFVIGCSFSFEEALVQSGVPVRHLDLDIECPIYKTNIPCAPAGRFHGPLVVSMRPMLPKDAIRAIQITSRFPNVHGSPVHFGAPADIGIKDINTVDYGGPVPIHKGEVPVFWGCGVTPQAVVEAAKPPFMITHKPNHLLVTDLVNAELAML